MWHYAAEKVVSSDGEISYKLVEAYPEVGPNVRTENPVNVYGSSPEELAKWLHTAADDVLKYPVFDDTND